DVHEHRLRARSTDRARRCEESERGGDHLISGSDIQSDQRQQERIGTRGTANPVLGPAILGDLGLERGNLRPKDEHLTVEDLANNWLDLIANRLVLRLEIQGGNADRLVWIAHWRLLP